MNKEKTQIDYSENDDDIKQFVARIKNMSEYEKQKFLASQAQMLHEEKMRLRFKIWERKQRALLSSPPQNRQQRRSMARLDKKRWEIISKVYTQIDYSAYADPMEGWFEDVQIAARLQAEAKKQESI